MYITMYGTFVYVCVVEVLTKSKIVSVTPHQSTAEPTSLYIWE